MAAIALLAEAVLLQLINWMKKTNYAVQLQLNKDLKLKPKRTAEQVMRKVLNWHYYSSSWGFPLEKK